MQYECAQGNKEFFYEAYFSAHRFINIILQDHSWFTWQESITQYTLPQVILLVYNTINQYPNYTVQDKEDLFKQLTDVLKEIDQEYKDNPNEAPTPGIMAGCLSGAFNQIIAVLDKKHPDVNIERIGGDTLEYYIRDFYQDKILALPENEIEALVKAAIKYKLQDECRDGSLEQQVLKAYNERTNLGLMSFSYEFNQDLYQECLTHFNSYIEKRYITIDLVRAFAELDWTFDKLDVSKFLLDKLSIIDARHLAQAQAAMEQDNSTSSSSALAASSSILGKRKKTKPDNAATNENNADEADDASEAPASKKPKR